VLKDAASNALYGARGANGVIMITTPKGQTGEATVNVDAKWGTNQRGIPLYNGMTDPGMYYETAYKALWNAFAAPTSDIIMFGSGFFMSCAVEEFADAVREASPVPADGSQAFVFENMPSNLSFLPSDEQKFVIKVGRSESVSETATTVNLVVDDPDDLFNVPSFVTFAAGATEAEILVTFDFQLGQKASLTVSFDEADAYLYGKPNCTINVLGTLNDYG
jgi:TonB-dependent SusC/RagA subfamily outer membrane receptor